MKNQAYAGPCAVCGGDCGQCGGLIEPRPTRPAGGAEEPLGDPVSRRLRWLSIELLAALVLGGLLGWFVL